MVLGVGIHFLGSRASGSFRGSDIAAYPHKLRSPVMILIIYEFNQFIIKDAHVAKLKA